MLNREHPQRHTTQDQRDKDQRLFVEFGIGDIDQLGGQAVAFEAEMPHNQLLPMLDHPAAGAEQRAIWKLAIMAFFQQVEIAAIGLRLVDREHEEVAGIEKPSYMDVELGEGVLSTLQALVDLLADARHFAIAAQEPGGL